MAFNSEKVARAIFSCSTPTLSAVGHEKDITISDLVADIRASTPTDAAHKLVVNYPIFFEKVDNLYIKIKRTIDYFIKDRFYRLDNSFYKIQNFKNLYKDLPERLLRIGSEIKRQELIIVINRKNELKEYFSIIKRKAFEYFATQHLELKSAYERIMILSPLATLDRGYSIVTNKQGSAIKDINQVAIGEKINIKLSKGSLLSKIVNKIKNE